MRNIFTLILIFSLNTCFGQTSNLSELIPFKKGEKFGYVNSKKKIVIPAQFDNAEPFSGNYAIVTVNEKIGTINKNGSYIIPPVYNPQWPFIFNEGLTPVWDPDTQMFGYLNEQGNWVIKPQYYRVEYFHEGIAAAWLNKDEWILIDKGNRKQWSSKENLRGYISGFFLIETRDNQNYRYTYGLLNKHGKLILPIQYDHIEPITNNFIKVEKNDRFGFVDSTGKEITPMEFECHFGKGMSIDVNSEDGLAAVCSNEKWGVMNSSGKIIIPLEYSSISFLGEGIIAAYESIDPQGIKIKFLDKNNKILFSKTMKGCPLFYSNGFCRVLEIGNSGNIKEDKNEGLGLIDNYIFIDKNGKEINNEIYYHARDFKEGLAMVVNKELKAGFINTSGKLVIDFKYDFSRFDSNIFFRFENGLCLIRKGDDYFYIDRNGNEYIEK